MAEVGGGVQWKKVMERICGRRALVIECDCFGPRSYAGPVTRRHKNYVPEGDIGEKIEVDRRPAAARKMWSDEEALCLQLATALRGIRISSFIHFTRFTR